MKKKFLLLTIIYILNSLSSFSQKLPNYYIVNGDTLGITLSLSQVKRIKNDLQLKSILEDMRISCDSTISKYILVVDNYEKSITSLKTIMEKLDSSNNVKKQIIDNLQDELILVKIDRNLCKIGSKTKDTLIDNYKKDIKKVKNQRNKAYISTIIFVITTIIALL